jgi:glycosyltransferase involved in cell wall biosynthesis
VQLTAAVITKNEERQIERCLRSLAFCDELLVLDSGSTDRTRELAAACGARVLLDPDWRGFATQRNRALAAAHGEWVLMVDADEWVPTELADAIRAALAAPGAHAAFRMPRLSSYCGQDMRHGGWWPDHVTRLMRRAGSRYEGEIHERCIVPGAVGTLTPALRHESFRDLDQVLAKVNAYSSAGARELVAKGRPASLERALLKGAWAFVRTYLLRAGFLDGRRGLMLAISNAEGTYYRVAKAWLAAQQDKPR